MTNYDLEQLGTSGPATWNSLPLFIIIIIIIIIFIFFKPSKNEGRKKLKKLKRMERLMFRAVVQLKTIVQQNRIETK